MGETAHRAFFNTPRMRGTALVYKVGARGTASKITV
ncbi:MAG: hypothetical protein GAK37_02070 [Pseudomonas sp.]|nr:MAG: hypothetical protein GAK37_02070 [Pseudomonas sp.]